jgi:hypothetical protein
MMEQNRIFNEVNREQGRMFEEAIKQYSDSNAKMFEEAIKQYSDSNAKMFEEAIRRQRQIFDDTIKQQGHIIDNAIKQYGERNAKIFNVTTKQIDKKSRQNVRNKRRS